MEEDFERLQQQYDKLKIRNQDLKNILSHLKEERIISISFKPLILGNTKIISFHTFSIF